MRVSSICAVILVGIVPLTGCASSQAVTYGDRSASLLLFDKELSSAKKKAFAGDGNAAFEVFIHYDFGFHDHNVHTHGYVSR